MTITAQFIWRLCFLTMPFLVIGQETDHYVKFTDYPSLPFYGFKKRNNTPFFQGNRQKKNYFEGWYFKMVSDNGSAILSVIPGISLSENGEKQHAFIQLINGKTAQTYYYTFPVESFSFSPKSFAIKIGDNYFSKNQLVLNIQTDTDTIRGDIRVNHITPYKIGKRSLAIMGWYRFVPFMECYHGVVSLTHDLSGSIQINQKAFTFDQGKGYIEKDWGESMPEAWVWMQSNHFVNANNSFMLSIANIPWLGKSFTGFLGFFYHEGTVYRFATYTNAHLTLEKQGVNQLKITIKNKGHTFVIEAKNSRTGLLKAPVNGSMDRRIAESVDAELKITLIDKNQTVIVKDSSKIAGLEIVGDLDQLLGKIK